MSSLDHFLLPLPKAFLRSITDYTTYVNIPAWQHTTMGDSPLNELRIVPTLDAAQMYMYANAVHSYTGKKYNTIMVIHNEAGESYHTFTSITYVDMDDTLICHPVALTEQWCQTSPQLSYTGTSASECRMQLCITLHLHITKHDKEIKLLLVALNYYKTKHILYTPQALPKKCEAAISTSHVQSYRNYQTIFTEKGVLSL